MGSGETELRLHLLFPKKSMLSSSKDTAPGIRWLIGSPLFLPPRTVVSVFRCLHTLPGDPTSPDLSEEADELRTLLLRGFDVTGALFFGNGSFEESARKAVEAASGVRNLLGRDGVEELIGASADLESGEIKFFVSNSVKVMERITAVVYEDNPEEYLWEKGCLLRCNLGFKLPIFFLTDIDSDIKVNASSEINSAAAKLKDHCTAYLIEESKVCSDGTSLSLLLHGEDLDLTTCKSNFMPLKITKEENSDMTLACSIFCSKSKYTPLSALRESADAIQVTVLSNKSKQAKSAAPIAEYLPASGKARLFSINFKLDILCYSSRDFPIAAAIKKLVVPGLLDQMDNLKKASRLENLTEDSQLHPYHFLPPGILHPITAIYELRYGETETKQAEIRKSLHSRLGLPLDRPILRVANALNFGIKDLMGSKSVKNGSPLLKDVHIGIPSSGVSGGTVSLIDGSYEYYHYLLHGIDDNGWGCAYRSLQTIISWYRLQQYTPVEVPSHRDIQQALVDIGDKEPSFIGSHEWIGAIELSFVLDKVLGASCKIINVRSGEELPEKCRELSMHFETQGTPVMIGGGVLAYTLLGVDYNEVSGDCAFLILDPHYTGSDDLKKIVNGGWCGWKKAVDSKGRNFFLKDKFYNLLLPQRPNMV